MRSVISLNYFVKPIKLCIFVKPKSGLKAKDFPLLGRSKCKYGTNSKDPIYQRYIQLKLIYGILPEDYDKMFHDQEGRCAICKTHQIELKRRLNIDHCHKTKKIRGLLCDNCNKGLGIFKDNPELLVEASKYINKSN